jgi:hypothetical protein
MLFNFELAPLQVVQPWGEPGNLHLHWFGLTDGRYWVQAGDATLFEYSEFVLERLGGSRYCDYQVARLYEDVLEMTPHVLEPLPAELVPYISGHSGRAWALTASAWREACAERADEADWDIVDASGTWIGNRTLDSGYLSPSASIHMWSDDSFVHIEWDNREKRVGSAHAWSALCGSYRLPRSDFVHEVQSFHARLMDEMGARVERVAAGDLPVQVQVDLSSLQREHEQRIHLSSHVFAGPARPTDWQAVLSSLREIKRGE